VSVSGAAEFERWLFEYERKLNKSVRKEITKTANKIRNRVMASMNAPAQGRLYIREPGQNRSREHRASAPGDAPAKDSGALVESIAYTRPKPFSARVSSDIFYASRLEFGDMRVQARPSFRPATDAEREPFAEAIREAMRRAAE
jgi:hypothetical protein